MAFPVSYQSAFGRGEEWRYAKVVCRPRFIDVREGEAATEVVYVPFDKRYSKAQAYRAAREIFNTHCTHDYDCCGYWYGKVICVDKVRGRTWRVNVRHVRNI